MIDSFVYFVNKIMSFEFWDIKLYVYLLTITVITVVYKIINNIIK